MTLLLASALVAEVGAGAGEPTVAGGRRRCSRSSSPPTGSRSCSRWRCRASRTSSGWRRRRSARDLVLTTLLVHLTGGAESAFAFMYILVIVGAAFVLGRGALVGGGGGGAALRRRRRRRARRCRCATLIRSLAVNAVAFAATGALATRLAIELRRAGEHIASQGVQAARSGGAARGRHPRPDLGPGHRRARRPHPHVQRRRGRDHRAQRRRRRSGGRSTRSCPGWRRCRRRSATRALRRGEVTQHVDGGRRAAHARRLAVAAGRLRAGAPSGASSTFRI